ncbi:hypothetical protein [Bacillus ndiopicus]|uniref:hypothetical protein n=1 Tax=Bacillus ndiopicus TaxID=1347368 RepID=UPI0005AB2A45|nr:hypothetical protein [Bacillus ndiopicus]
MKKAKKIVLFIAIGTLILYLLICIVCMVSYNHILKTLIPVEQVIYSGIQSTGGISDDRFIVYLDDENIVFRKITDVYISPSGVVKIPTIEYEYTYVLNDPAKSTVRERRKDYSLSDRVNDMIFIAKDYRIVGAEKGAAEFEGYYFGYRREGNPIDKVSKYAMIHEINEGYLFLFYAKENPDFDETVFDVIYF